MAAIAPQPAPTPADESLAQSAWGDRAFKLVLTVAAVAVPLILVALLWQLVRGAAPAVNAFGLSFIIDAVWDPVADRFGALPLIFGTLVTSLLALLLAVPLSLGVAIYLTEFAPPAIRQPIAMVIELLAAIPSVVYGLWGIFVLVPILQQSVFPFLEAQLGWLPLFRGPIYGPSILSASLILTIMVMPFIMSIAREVLLAVPSAQREAAMAMGATRWEAVTTAIVPYARSGIVGAVILGLGRALGETMAVTMLIGNRHDIPSSLLAPGYSMAAVIANEFAEAGMGTLHASALTYVALLLFAITIAVNGAARLLIWRMNRRAGG